MIYTQPEYELPPGFPQTSPQPQNMARNIEKLTNTTLENTIPTETTING